MSAIAEIQEIEGRRLEQLCESYDRWYAEQVARALDMPPPGPQRYFTGPTPRKRYSRRERKRRRAFL